MDRRGMLGAVLITVIGALMTPANVYAQNAQTPAAPTQAQPKPPADTSTQAKPLKDQLVGTWRLLIADEVAPDNTQKPLFGPNAMGIAMFGADGHYSVQIRRAVLPKFASNNRTTGSADENKAVVQGMLTHFGTYSVDEGNKSLMLRIEGSSFPNWDDTKQTRIITSLTPGDELTWTVPASAGAPPVNVAWKWVK